MGELASAVTGELHGAYLRLPQQRREVLLGLVNHVDHQTARRLRTADARQPACVQRCAEALGDPVWRGRSSGFPAQVRDVPSWLA